MAFQVEEENEVKPEKLLSTTVNDFALDLTLDVFLEK